MHHAIGMVVSFRACEIYWRRESRKRSLPRYPVRGIAAMLRRVPLVFSPQPDGGFTVTSPVLPELVTEGDTLDEAYANVPDALAAVLELYAEQGRSLPESTKIPDSGEVIRTESLVE